MNNATVRGGGILQRTGWKYLTTVHAGDALYQGGYLYIPDFENPQLIVSIGGRIYQVRVDTDNSVADLSAAFGLTNPPLEPQAFMCQGEQFLIIQAGDLVTHPLFFDGTTLRRSLGLAGSELPAATAMDYYMGRLWYAQGRQYTAGDIVAGPSGTLPYRFRDSILKVTENPLAIGGDGFIVPTTAGNIRGITHTAELDTALGQGRLYIGTRRVIYRNNVPVTRTEWIAATNSNQPLQTVSQTQYGFVNDRSIVRVNGDLFYQTFQPGIQSLTLATRFFQQWGNTPISSNEDRVFRFNDRALMKFASGIEFDNRLLQTALPLQKSAGVVSQAIVPLDFDLISSLEEKLPPAWEGMYEGLDVLQLFEADFGGLQRAFALVISRVTGAIDLWELTTADRFENGDNRVTWIVETPHYTWNKEFELKRLDGGEIWLDKLFGTVLVEVFYRVDADPCWQYWHSQEICAARSTCEDVENPVCYPEQGYCEGFRFPLTLPTPPRPACETMNSRPMNLGYQFQVRLRIKGWCRVRGLLVHAIPTDKAPFGGLSC